MTANAFNNEVVDGCVGDGIMPGFDGNQFQRNSSSVPQQQQSNTVGTSALSPPVSAIPMPSGSHRDHDQQQRAPRKKDLITSLTAAASVRLAAAAAEKES